MSAAHEALLKSLGSMDIHALRRTWRAQFRELAPRCRSAEFLRCEIAWRTQAKAEGGVDRITGARLRAEGRIQASTPAGRRTRPPALPVGARLLREWRGRQHHVEVGAAGYVYEGQTYRSLSLIARKITGARWSGPRFFGVKT